jgi:hypothetical protein
MTLNLFIARTATAVDQPFAQCLCAAPSHAVATGRFCHQNDDKKIDFCRQNAKKLCRRQFFLDIVRRHE